MRSRIEALAIAFAGAMIYALVAGSLADAAYIPVPSGSILYFNRSTATGCPVGWTEFTAARGAYIVGLPNGGTQNSLVGTALTNLENRAVGQHTHTLTVTLNDPGHTHNGRTFASPVAGNSRANPTASADSTNGSGADNFTTSNTTGITVSTATAANTGSVVGTNAPYIHLLVCSKS